MSLQTKLLVLVTSLTLMLALAIVGREIAGTRRSVHEEIRTAHRVAVQLIGHLASRPLAEAAQELAILGRIRAHDTLLLDAAGRTIHRSPQSPYKPGRVAPGWFAEWVTPSFADHSFDLPDGGRLLLKTDPSRAVIDGWDDFIALVQWLTGGLALLGALCWQLVRRALAPLARIEAALRDIQQGRLATRLPPLPGREAKLMSEAFNDMAQGLQDRLAARDEARQAQTRLLAAQDMAVAVQRRIEEERRHIARELHDEMGQQITAIRSFGLVIANRAAGTHAGLQEAARLLVDATAKLHDALRRIIPRLRPVALDQFGLRDALLDLIADCRLQAPSIHFDVRLPAALPQLDEAVSTALYRAAQEALTNIIKHAGAGHASLTLHAQASRTMDDECSDQTTCIQLEIEDDGCGLPAGSGSGASAASAARAVSSPNGFGLLGMRERIESLNGALTFSPLRQVANGEAPCGLRVTVTMPLVRHGGAA